MGQEPYSCDTTQIDILFRYIRSLMRSVKRTPIDNGRVPVGRYSEIRFPFTPPSAVHSLRIGDRDHTARGSLDTDSCKATTLLQRFDFILVIVAQQTAFVNRNLSVELHF